MLSVNNKTNRTDASRGCGMFSEIIQFVLAISGPMCFISKV